MPNIFNADNGVVSGSAGIKLSSDTSGVLNIQTNGTTAISISSSQVVSFPSTTSIGTLYFAAGTAAAPSISVTGDTNTGIYFPAADTIAFTEGGTEALRINSSAQIAVNTAGTAGAPVITKTDDLNTGIFFPAADTIAFSEGGVESMRLDSSGNLGIGTSSPVTKLDVAVGNNGGMSLVQTGANQEGFFNFTNNSGTANGGISYDHSTNSMRFKANGSERMRLDSSGNLGIGTTSTGNNRLIVSSAVTGSNNTNLRVECTGSGGSSIDFASGSTGHYIFGNGSLPLVFGTNGTERARITSDGNFVVGTTSSSRRFQASFSSSTAYSSSSMETSSLLARIVNPDGTVGNYAGIHFAAANNSDAAIAGVRTADAEMAITFGTRGSGSGNIIERARITSGGRFCIGDTSSNYLLRVGGAINNNAKIGGLTIGQSASEYPSAGYNVRFTTTINTYNYDGSDFAAMIRYAQNDGRIETFTAASGTGGNQITFTTGPYVANLGTSWTNSSDERLKNITGEIQNGLAKVCSLRAAEFTWKTGGTGKQQVGLIAQDVLNVLPEVVVIPDAEFDGTAGTAMGVNYDQTIPLLVAAIKELKSELDQLKGKL